MAAIKETKWEEVNVHTWNDLSLHLWEDFRIALMEPETDLEVQGVVLKHSGATNEVASESDAQGVRVEFSQAVMTTKTEMINSIVVSERDYITDMTQYLPLYERRSGVFRETLLGYDRELRSLEQRLEVATRNMFIGTAIESLPIYERDLGIKTVGKLRYDQRREQISSRNRAIFEQTTEDMIKNVSAAFSNGKVEVDKTSTPGVYEIKFVGTLGIPDNMEGLKEAIDIIVPAHLGFAYSFIFNTWDVVSDKTWNEASSMTWQELRANEVS